MKINYLLKKEDTELPAKDSTNYPLKIAKYSLLKVYSMDCLLTVAWTIYWRYHRLIEDSKESLLDIVQNAVEDHMELTIC